MRKLFYLLISLIMIFLYSCGSSQDEKRIEYPSDTVVRDDDFINDVGGGSTIVATDSTIDYVVQPPTIDYIPPPPPPPHSTIIRNINLVITDSMKVEKGVKNIGEIRHLIKNTMYYKVTDTVEMTISYKQNNNRVLREVGTFRGADPSNITRSSIEISPCMRARLIDPTRNSFVIVPVTDTVQYIDMKSDEYTLWRWMVTPIKGGSHDLILSVDMIIGDYKKSIDIYQSRIYVEISDSAEFWIWVKSNWTYITYVIGLIGAIFAFLYKEKIINIFKKKEKIINIFKKKDKI